MSKTIAKADKLIDQGLAALAALVPTERAAEAEESAAKKLADFLANRKAEIIRARAAIIESDWINLSLTSEDPEDAGKLKRLVNMSAEEAAADDGLAVQMLDAVEAIIKAKRDSLKPNVPGPSNGGEEDEGAFPTPAGGFIQSPAEFVASRKTPDYLIRPIFQRRYCYSITAQTDTGKTSVTMRVSAHVAIGRDIDSNVTVKKGQVLYFCGENPEDVQNRWLGLCQDMNIDPTTTQVHFISGAMHLSKVAKRIEREIKEKGLEPVLIVVDTSAAYFEGDNRKAAMEEVHKVVLEIEGRAGRKTYHQHIAAEDIRPDAWRPHILLLLRELRYDPAVFSSADAWHERAKELLAPFLPLGGQTIAQRLRRNQELGTALAVAPKYSPPARTIHSVKGMEFPAVCVVMTVATAKGIIDYLETGSPAEQAESVREIYVAASRAERLLVIASPKSQADRLAAHLATTGAEVTMITL